VKSIPRFHRTNKKQPPIAKLLLLGVILAFGTVLVRTYYIPVHVL